MKFDSFYAAESIRIKNEVDKSMEEDPTPAQLPKLVKRQSKNATISQLVRQNTVHELQKKKKQVGREYRIITAGDDGMIFWWNLTYSPPMQPSQTDSLVVFVDVKTIVNIRPVHEIHLTASAQIYCVSILKNVLTICQNDGIMSYYTCNYGGIEDEETPTD